MNIHVESPQGLENPLEQNVFKDPVLMEEALKEAQEDEDEKERQEFEQAVAKEVESETQALLD